MAKKMCKTDKKPPKKADCDYICKKCNRIAEKEKKLCKAKKLKT